MNTTWKTIGFPTERFMQLQSLAVARELSPAALIEAWIDCAVEKDEPGAIALPGYTAFRDDDVLAITIAGHALPFVTRQRAALLATVLNGASGTKAPKTQFDLPVGRAVPVPLDKHGSKLVVGRHGRGVVFVLESDGETTRFAAPPGFVATLAREIWREVGIEGAEGSEPPLPGFELVADLDDDTGEPVVIFNCNLCQPVFLTPSQTQAIAAGLRSLLDGSAARFEVEAQYAGYDARFIGTRKGRGYVFSVLDNVDVVGREPIQMSGLTRTIAEDLAGSFDAAASKATALGADRG